MSTVKDGRSRRTRNEEPTPQPVNPRHLEMAVLGYVVANPGLFYHIQALQDSHFTDPSIRRAISVMRKLYDSGGHDAIGTPALVVAKLAEAGVDENNAFALLTEAADFAPRDSGIDPVVKELASLATKRALGEAAEQLAGMADTTMSAEDMAAAAMEAINIAVRQTVKDDVRSLAEIIEEECIRLERIRSGDLSPDTGYQTGLDALDNIIGGFGGGEVIIVAGRPSMGKSSLLNKFAESIALAQQVPGILFSCEMKEDEYTRRLICNRAGVNIQDAKRGTLSPDKHRKYIGAARDLQQAPIFMEAVADLTPQRMAAVVHRYYHEYGVRWAGVDYLQLLNHLQQKGESKTSAIGRSSRAMKVLAMGLNIPVIVLSQLNRGPESRNDNRPRLSDLRESGDIEQDADVVLMIYRDSAYNGENESNQVDGKDIAEIIVAKQRNGPLGTAKVVFDNECAAFRNMDPGSGYSTGDMPSFIPAF